VSDENSVCVLVLRGAKRNSVSYSDLYEDPEAEGVPRIKAMDHELS